MSITAYHFVGATLRDGRPVPPDGEWLVHSGPVVLCESGLHASRTPWQALSYAPGAVLCRVEVDGEIAEDDDKLVATRRRIVQRADVTDALRAFACDEALSVAHLWECPEVVRRYLESRDESLRDAALSAARNMAWSAAWNATWSAAHFAAQDAALGAARNVDAARGAAWRAARDAALGATWDATLNATRSAAWNATQIKAWAASRDAARNAQAARFNDRMYARVGKQEDQ